MKIELTDVLHRCESITDWTKSAADTLALESAFHFHYEGSYSIQLIISAANCWAKYTPPTNLDLSSYNTLRLWQNSTPAGAGRGGVFTIGSAAGDYNEYNFTWINLLGGTVETIDLTIPDAEVGAINWASIDYFMFSCPTSAAGDTFYWDLIEVIGDITSDIIDCKITEELYTSSYAELRVKGESLDLFDAGLEMDVYDSDNVLSWSGRVLYPEAVLEGTQVIGKLKVLGISEEFEQVSRKSFTTLRDSDYILKYILDNTPLKKMYYDDEIDNFTLTYKYDLKTKIWKMARYQAMLERAVIHYKPDGEIFFNKYNNLTASGMSWNQATDYVKIVKYTPLANRHITRAPVIGTVNSKGQVYYVGKATNEEDQKYGINQLQPWKDPEISNYTEAKQLGDNLQTIYSMDTQVINMLTVGKKHIQVGYTIQVSWTGLFTISVANFLVTKRIWKPMEDLCELRLTDNILTERQFYIKVINKFYDQDVQEAFELPDLPESTADGTVIPGVRHDRFVWRDNAAGEWDFREGGGNTDFSTIGNVANTWYDLDLSSIIPNGAHSVLFKLQIQDGAADIRIRFRRNGETGTSFTEVETQRPNANYRVPAIIVGCDTSQIIEFNSRDQTVDSWTNIDMLILGCWI